MEKTTDTDVARWEKERQDLIAQAEALATATHRLQPEDQINRTLDAQGDVQRRIVDLEAKIRTLGGSVA